MFKIDGMVMKQITNNVLLQQDFLLNIESCNSRSASEQICAIDLFFDQRSQDKGVIPHVSVVLRRSNL